LQQRVRALELAELAIDAAQREVELRLHERLAIERPCERESAIDERDDAQVVRGTRSFVTAVEQLQHELLDALRAIRFGDGGIAGDREPRRVEGDERHDRHDDRSRRPGAPAVPSDEFLRSIADAVGTRLERLASKVVDDVAAKRLDRSVPPLQILVQGRQAERVQIRPCVPPAAEAQRSGGRERHARRLVVANDALDFGRRPVRQIEERPVREQLVQDGAERVHIRLHAGRPPTDLLRRRVGGRHQSYAGDGRVEHVDLLGNAEVEQLHAAFRRHQDVGWLQIPVHDGLAVRVLNGVADLQKQPKAVFH